jgi:hypothetical protein
MSLNAASMLRHLNGKYSAYDMAQYIFWTGDEQGVAKAVEELIDEGLMSRENAIEFLNDIRLGIDYLENTYTLKNGESKNVRKRYNEKNQILQFFPFINRQFLSLEQHHRRRQLRKLRLMRCHSTTITTIKSFIASLSPVRRIISTLKKTKHQRFLQLHLKL